MGQKIGHRQFSREFKRNALQLVMEKEILACLLDPLNKMNIFTT